MSDGEKVEQDGDGVSVPDDAFTEWLASSALRVGLVIIGVFLLLAALGQPSGTDMLGVAGEFLGTEAGRSLLVAAVALALIGIAVYGFTGRS